MGIWGSLDAQTTILPNELAHTKFQRVFTHGTLGGGKCVSQTQRNCTTCASHIIANAAVTANETLEITVSTGTIRIMDAKIELLASLVQQWVKMLVGMRETRYR
jgi:hypothetical protein